jgi:hypothetical protein
MVITRRRVAVGALTAVYLTGAGFLVGLVTERIQADRDRVAVVRAREQRQREAREQAIRVELQHEAGRTASRPR